MKDLKLEKNKSRQRQHPIRAHKTPVEIHRRSSTYVGGHVELIIIRAHFEVPIITITRLLGNTSHLEPLLGNTRHLEPLIIIRPHFGLPIITITRLLGNTSQLEPLLGNTRHLEPWGWSTRQPLRDNQP
jgi:hypothetical protein